MILHAFSASTGHATPHRCVMAKCELLKAYVHHPTVVELAGDGTMFRCGWTERHYHTREHLGGHTKAYPIAVLTPETWVADLRVSFH